MEKIRNIIKSKARYIAESVGLLLVSEYNLLCDVASFLQKPVIDVLKETIERLPEYMSSFIPGYEIIYRNKIMLPGVTTTTTLTTVTNTLSNIVRETIIVTPVPYKIENSFIVSAISECHFTHFRYNYLLPIVLAFEIGVHKDAVEYDLNRAIKYVKRNLGRSWNEKVRIPRTYKNIGTLLDQLYNTYVSPSSSNTKL